MITVHLFHLYKHKLGLIARWTGFFGILVATTLGVSESNLSAAPKTIRANQQNLSVGQYLAGQHAQYIQELNEAVRYFSSALSGNPDNADLQSRIFSILVSSGRVKQSLPLADRIAKSNLSNVALPVLVLALKDIRAGSFDKAVKRLSALPNSGINDFSLPLIEAWSLASTKKFDDAIKILEDRMKNPGMVALFAPHAALIAELAGYPKAGEKFLKDTLIQYRQIGPNLTRLLGEFYERTNQTAKAKAIYLNYIEASPNSTMFNYSLKRANASQRKKLPKLSITSGIAEALFGLSTSLRRQNPHHAIIYARLAIFVNPEFSFAKLRLADELTREDRLHEALATYKNISRDPVYGWTARLRTARTYNFLDKTNEATRILKDMAKEKKDRVGALVNLGTMYRNRMRYQDAVNSFEKAKKRIKFWKKQHWKLLYGNAACLERLKRWSAAEKDFLKALKLNPNEPSILNYLGYSWIEQGQHIDRAHKMIETAVKKRPQAAHIVDSLGWVQFKLGDMVAAVQNLERAALLMPADPTINDHLGDAYWKVGRKLEARFQWQKTLSLEPEKDLIPTIKKKITKGLPDT